jgi:hypothetical protein
MAHELLRLYLNDSGPTFALSDEDLNQVLAKVDGDFYAAVAEGWRIKAGNVAHWYRAELDGSDLSRDQVFKHCMFMAETYEDKGGAQMKNIGLRTRPELKDGEFI